MKQKIVRFFKNVYWDFLDFRDENKYTLYLVVFIFTICIWSVL